MKIELTEDEVIQIGERRYWNSQPWYKILFPPLNRKPFAAGRQFLEEQKILAIPEMTDEQAIAALKMLGITEDEARQLYADPFKYYMGKVNKEV